MNIDTNQIVSISEANQNFSRVARLAEQKGTIVIFKNNKPKFKLVDLEQKEDPELTDDEKIDLIAARISSAVSVVGCVTPSGSARKPCTLPGRYSSDSGRSRTTSRRL